MRKKTVSMIFAGLTALSGILPHAPKIIPEGNSLIAAAAIAATLSIPSKSVAAIMPARIVQLAAISMSRNCEAGVMDQLCSSVTSFLNDEATKTDADLKACKDKCGWKKRKDDLIDAARKKAKESCSKGEAPNVNELSKGLDRNTKDRLKDLYNRNSRMFDGTAKLASKDFDVKSGQAPAITGKGGQVTDLKLSEPDSPKLNTASEFSLSGTKLSGGSSTLAVAKPTAVLLASASSVKAPADTTPSASTEKSLAITAPAARAAGSTQKAGASPYASFDACFTAYELQRNLLNQPIEQAKKQIAANQQKLDNLYAGKGNCDPNSPYFRYCKTDITGWENTNASLRTTIKDLEKKRPDVLQMCGSITGLSDEEKRKLYIEAIKSKIVASDKVSPEAVKAAKDAIDKMFRNADTDVLKTLAEKPFKIYIFAKNENLTDLPESGFAKLKGQDCNGTPCEKVTGLTLYPDEGGHIAVSETNFFEGENIFGKGHDEYGYPVGYTLLHELSHQILLQGLPEGPPSLLPRLWDTTKGFFTGLFEDGFSLSNALSEAKLGWNPPSVERITELYNSYMARNEHTGFGSGADQNVNENFAFAAGLYFGNTNYFQYDTSAGFADLQKHQPEMFELFIKIFGTTKSPAI